MKNILILFLTLIFNFNVVFAAEPDIPAYQGEVRPGITFNNSYWNVEGKKESHAIVPRVAADSPGHARIIYSSENSMPGPSGSPEIDSTFGPAYDELAHKGVFTFALDFIDEGNVVLEFDSGLEYGEGKPFVWFLTMQTKTRPVLDSTTLGTHNITNDIIAYGVCMDGTVAKGARDLGNRNAGVDFSSDNNRVTLYYSRSYYNYDYNLYWFYPGENKATDCYFLMPHYYVWENSVAGYEPGIYGFDTSTWSMNEMTAWAERDYKYYYQVITGGTSIRNDSYVCMSANYGYPLINPTEHDEEYVEVGAGYTILEDSSTFSRPNFFYPFVYIDWTYLNSAITNHVTEYNLYFVATNEDDRRHGSNNFVGAAGTLDSLNRTWTWYDYYGLGAHSSSSYGHIDGYDTVYINLSPRNMAAYPTLPYHNAEIFLPICIVNEGNKYFGAPNATGSYMFYRVDNYLEAPVSPLTAYGRAIYETPRVDYEYDPEYPDHPGDPDYPDRPSHPDYPEYGGTTGDKFLEDILDFNLDSFDGFNVDMDKISTYLNGFIVDLGHNLDAITLDPVEALELKNASVYVGNVTTGVFADLDIFNLMYLVPLSIGVITLILGV